MKMKRLVGLLMVIMFFSCSENPESNGIVADGELDSIPSMEAESEQGMEIVFCLDATGSMSGLIGTAKEKIWAIVSEVAEDTLVENLKLGMVFYRDRGDAFVTRPIHLTNDLDSVYSELLAIEADGGGDSPESVNQALYEALTVMQWSESRNVYKTIFVVGDCPPHMNYPDDVKYTESCEMSAERGIIINTIKLGDGCREAISHFQKMAECTNGEYLQLDQNATDYVISTPYDEEINKISSEIEDSKIYYGSASVRQYNYSKKEKSMGLYSEGSVEANTDRVKYKNSKAGFKEWVGTNELITDISENKVKLKDLKEDELPEELRNKTKEEKERILKEIKRKRRSNQSKLVELNKKRTNYIQQEKESRGEDSSFSKDVVDIMNKQANELREGDPSK